MFGDFNHSNLGNAQGLIYKKMLECRKTAEPKKPDSDTSVTLPNTVLADYIFSSLIHSFLFRPDTQKLIIM